MSYTNLKLYSIIFIDSLCIAFLPPVMASHMISLGGNHTILGTLGSIHAVAQLFSGPLIHSWNGIIGKKKSLMLAILIYCATYYFLGIVPSCLAFIMLRACFALMNQAQSLCKSIAATENEEKVMDSVNNLMNVVGVAGLIVGPIIGGYFFDYFGFYYVTLTATFLLVLSYCIALTLQVQNIHQEDASFMTKANQDIISPLRNLLSVEFKARHLLLLKGFYTASLTIFFIKFSYPLKFNTGISFSAIGLTYAYQSLVMFLSSFAVNYFSPALDQRALLRWLCIMCIMLCILSNTQSYILYLGSFVALAIAHGVLTRLFRELFAHNNISNHEESVTKVITVVIPAVFGIVCDFYGLMAYNVFVILPIACDIFLVYAYVQIIEKDKEDNEENDQVAEKKEE